MQVINLPHPQIMDRPQEEKTARRARPEHPPPSSDPTFPRQPSLLVTPPPAVLLAGEPSTFPACFGLSGYELGVSDPTSPRPPSLLVNPPVPLLVLVYILGSGFLGFGCFGFRTSVQSSRCTQPDHHTPKQRRPPRGWSYSGAPGACPRPHSL